MPTILALPDGVELTFFPGGGVSCPNCQTVVPFTERTRAVTEGGDLKWVVAALVDATEDDLRAILAAAEAAAAAKREGRERDGMFAVSAAARQADTPTKRDVLGKLATLATPKSAAEFWAIVGVLIAILALMVTLRGQSVPRTDIEREVEKQVEQQATQLQKAADADAQRRLRNKMKAMRKKCR